MSSLDQMPFASTLDQSNVGCMATPEACDCCGSTRLRHQVFGMLSHEEFDRLEADPNLVMGGCALGPDSWQTECPKCGYRVLIEDRATMRIHVAAGDTFESKGRPLTVSELEEDVLPRVRVYLIGAACRREQVTYGQLKEGASLPHAVNGMGHLLDALSEDCIRRGEPSLAALVVSATTGRIGKKFGGDAESELAHLRAAWPRSVPSIRRPQIDHTTRERRENPFMGLTGK